MFDVQIEAAEGRFWLRDTKDGELFYNERNEPRSWSTVAGAKRWMRNTCKKVPSVAFRVTDTKGKVSFIGITETEYDVLQNPDDYGPHDWRKQNVVTILDSSGLYDIWECVLCGDERKRYGLSGPPMTSGCPSNPNREDNGDKQRDQL